MTMNKAEQRKLCLGKRKDLSDEQRTQYSKIINEKLIPFVKDKTVCSYKPSKYEVDVYEILDAYYPVVVDEENMQAYKSNNFVLNRYNILEPDTKDATTTDDFDVIIVPLVGFDEKCNRLGHGKGYYDRFLKNSRTLKIGLAFEAQKLDEIVTNENDIKLDYIITEKDIYRK